jgi:Bifunctional DNA primase/polymerase, N-terminal
MPENPKHDGPPPSTPEPNLKAALEMAQAGIPVLPMRVFWKGGKWNKRPAIKNWRTRATTDPATIEAWAREDPARVFAIELEAAGLVVIDCDRHREDADGCSAFEQLVEAHGGIASVPTTISSGGGLHFYFRQPAVPIGCPVKTRLPPGIDVKGAGGNIVVPGSRRPDGAQWRPMDGKPSLAQAYRNGLADIPEWLEKLARKVERAEPKPDQRSHRKASSDRERAYAAAALDWQCRDIAGLAANSNRNKQLNAAAFGLGRLVARGWIDDAKVTSGLTDAAARCGLLKDDGERAVRATIASGLAAGFKEPHPDLPDNDHDPAAHDHAAASKAPDGPPRDESNPMLLAMQQRELRLLHGIRRANTHFPAWLAAMRVDPAVLYDADTLGRKVSFTIAEDEAFATSTLGRKPVRQVRKGRTITLTAARFPQRLVPAVETRLQARKRRKAFTRKKATTMEPELQLHAAGTGKPAVPVTRMQAVLGALPAPPGRITIRDLARKLRRHRAWRDTDGNMLGTKSIETAIRMMRQTHPDISSVLRPPTAPRGLPTWLLWRRPS